jgi:hypothetical protein
MGAWSLPITALVSQERQGQLQLALKEAQVLRDGLQAVCTLYHIEGWDGVADGIPLLLRKAALSFQRPCRLVEKWHLMTMDPIS